MDDARREALERWEQAWNEPHVHPFDRMMGLRHAGNELARLLREDALVPLDASEVSHAAIDIADRYTCRCPEDWDEPTHIEACGAPIAAAEIAGRLSRFGAAGRGEGEGPQPKEVMPHADGDSAAAPVSVAPSPAPAVPSLADDPKAVRIWGELRAAESARSTGEG